MSTLSLTDAVATLGGVRRLDGASFTAPAGAMTGLLGPNGAGKTTAVRALLGLTPLDSGQARIGVADPRRLDAAARARAVAYLPQTRPLAWPMAVRDVVALGRFAHGGLLGRPAPEDAAAVAQALAACDLEALADRPGDMLSGGERARMHVARALAAQTPALVADEPTAALDPRHAIAVLDILKARATAGAAVLVILHDLPLAARTCDRIVLMDSARVVADGSPQDVLTPERIADVYGVAARWRDGALMVEGLTPVRG
jgi:iron complex transport system ATP-binding protein